MVDSGSKHTDWNQEKIASQVSLAGMGRRPEEGCWCSWHFRGVGEEEST